MAMIVATSLVHLRGVNIRRIDLGSSDELSHFKTLLAERQQCDNKIVLVLNEMVLVLVLGSGNPITSTSTAQS